MEAGLTEQVRRKLAAWRYLQERPPATMAEIVVMVLVLNPPLTKRAILQYLFENFEYYKQLASDFFSESMLSTNSSYFARKPLPDFSKVFGLFDVPLIEDNALATAPRSRATTWTVRSAASRFFLASNLSPETQGGLEFPFLSLPADIRMLIYEFALVLPQSGILMDNQNMLYDRYSGPQHRPTLQVFSRRQESLEEVLEKQIEVDSTMTAYKHNRDLLQAFRHGRTLTGRPYRMHLALFLACKQVYREAMPVFYGQNTFVCRSLDQLQGFLKATPEPRRSYLRHITFYFDTSHTRGIPAALKMLKKQHRLQSLHIWVSEHDWLTLWRPGSLDPRYSDVSEIPGVTFLRSFRGLKNVAFQGDCASLRSLLQADMIKPRSSASSTTSKAKAKTRRTKQASFKLTE